MAQWIKTHKIYAAGAAIALAAFLYYFFMPVQEAELLPEIEQTVQLNEKEDDDKEMETEGDEQAEQMPQPMKADIKGAVQKPGVYEAAEGDRVIDLLEKAGGLTDKADGTKINFALNITDEMVIYVPEKGEILEEATVEDGKARGQQDNGKINLNQANESELQMLPGIGPSKAAAIIEHRETNGPFKDVADLKLISGIGEKTFEKLKEHISVK
ncbi:MULTISPECIES: helix-hairpin-helix domain-containing protein [Cytobacillus]|jgi:competence protein ComEA|uniref:helix-hairpin-helix domain-containing protein n=1 Tax=Cytobacillus TaxID=2675230 RepID=UPI00203AD467|nr:helix-hairpin-helix domain-containing protein [Cytobacillus oceanisediminis]MBY0154429.1 helix-hairpin-helix domain-containing protein [Cytobacillus firmus]MCM3529796.1 helix-hairpin-helix domain-containing protein [Cytobacillus oceanisediminis]USK43185.1 helix-hairpin-helix domain-containing protein [Cytobacillus oceanisediminis]